ncbi:MAG: hypothetical protein ABFC54_02960 [Thermoguttaceae bacterium]
MNHRYAAGSPSPKAAAWQFFSVTCRAAWRWLFALVHDGLLVEVEKGDAKRHRASRYCYLGD